MKRDKTHKTAKEFLTIVFLGIIITISLIVSVQYSDLLGMAEAFVNGTSSIKYPNKLSIQDIEDLNGLFPDDLYYQYSTDNMDLPRTGEMVLMAHSEVAENFEITKVVTSSSTSLNNPSVTVTVNPKITLTPTKSPGNTPSNIPTIIPTTISARDYSKPWQVAPNCPSSTQNCVPCYLGDSLCRIETGETRGFRGWACQNNNPGNIRPINNYNDTNDFRNRLIVSMGGTPSCGIRTGTGGSYMVFTDYTTGFNSLKAYISAINAGMHTAYIEKNPDGSIVGVYGNCSLTFFMNKWASNPSAGYKQTISNYLGVDPNTTTLESIVNGGKLNDLANGIKIAEGFIVQ